MIPTQLHSARCANVDSGQSRTALICTAASSCALRRARAQSAARNITRIASLAARCRAKPIALNSPPVTGAAAAADADATDATIADDAAAAAAVVAAGPAVAAAAARTFASAIDAIISAARSQSARRLLILALIVRD
eukprot:6196749-Pleurochrysis_carterae.AAC.1